MTNYLLIHGALRGAWLWDRVMPLLMKQGDNPIAIDLPGHGDRADERRGLTMSSYIEDALSFIRKENLHDLVVVGHSMSGFIVSKIAEEMPERVKHLVYLAAVVPKNNDSLLDLLPQERQKTLRSLRGKVNEVFGPLEALRTAYFTDLEGKEQESYLRQLTPEPLGVFFEKIRFRGLPDRSLPRTYILGMRDKSLPPVLTEQFAARLGVEPRKIEAGHDMMVSRPAEVVERIVSAVTSS